MENTQYIGMDYKLDIIFNGMKHFVIQLFFLFTGYVLFAQTPANDPHWQLVWDDDFNTIDPNKWDIYDWAHGHYVENQIVINHTIFLADNVTVSNGNLEITTKNITTYCPVNPPSIYGSVPICQNGTYPFSSGWVSSKQAFNTQYGYVESKIKMSHGYGYWPAFWTFIGDGVSNSSNAAEIDIFEMLSNLPSNVVTTNIHWTYDPFTPDPDVGQKHLLNNFDYTNWHTYAIEWTPSKIIWYVDGRVIRNMPYHNIVDPIKIIFSSIIDHSHPPNFSTTFPLKMFVDYVKVYEVKKDCNNLINACNYNFSNYDNQVKNSITIGNGGCTNSINSGDNVTIRASEFINLSGNFSVPLGASFYADANKECSNTLSLNCTHLFNQCNYNFLGYDNAVKKEIDLGGANCSVPINPTSNHIFLKATEKVTLKSGVTITPQNGNLVELSIVNCP